MEEKIKWSDQDLKNKFSNFWYYYKWHTIAAIFVLVAAVLLIAQVTGREKNDGYVYYAGEIFFTAEQAGKLEHALESAMRSDPDGNGEKKLQLITQVILSPGKQASALHEAREEEEDGSFIYAGDTTQNEKDHYEQMAYGEAVICLLDEAYFEKAVTAGRLAPLSDALGHTPDGAVNAYGIRLCDTAIGQYFEILQALPKDTVLCLKAPTVQYQNGGLLSGLFRKKQDGKNPNAAYQAQLQILRELLDFRVE